MSAAHPLGTDWPPTNAVPLRDLLVAIYGGPEGFIELRRLRHAGQFPEAARLSPAMVVWLESDIGRWIAERVAGPEVR